ncbi:nucleotide exchange factor GrpE [Isoalcanivorax indicus]|uniref:nucleotide exchange factor GrpE n=1 Tax=Isoalcanivorax indicus TaxID=2202653 RepID=UPI000DBA7D8D|nr:nucleotide exchange factor GrpE [Isoalcanivorax indicus]
MSDQDRSPNPEQDAAQKQAEEVAREAVEQARADEVEAAPEEASGRDPEAELAALRDELAQARKALGEADLRAQAEIQNMRRRVERDVEAAHKYALEKFAAEVITVADSLERALTSLDADNEALAPAREGTELTLKVLLDVFGRFNIAQIDPKGETFNPEQHEAMAMVPQPEAAPNSVIDVLEKGYTLNGRLLRPARVVVARAE